jgi:hypothetical protein
MSMRYVAISQTSPWSPTEIVGVGDTMDEAYAGARAWFEHAFDKFGEQRWNELVAMQNNLDAVSEEVLQDRTGATLDEWLVRLASLGQSPSTPQPPKPPRPPGSPMVTKVNSGWELSVWIIAAILILGGQIINLAMHIRAHMRDGDLSSTVEMLLVGFVVTVAVSILWAAIWFWIFSWFKEDATLQDFLFFLFILEFAGVVVDFMLDGVNLMGVPVLGFR